ncbi:MAG: hypothetical protein PWR00_895 [Thermovirga sp.]|jgi:hypothetical protein|nr:hypothetical protein [Thermovirga sp.]
METQKSIEKLAETLGAVTARLVESVSRSNQLAGGLSPQLQELFDRWLSIIADEVLKSKDPMGKINIEETSKRIGIDKSSVICLLQYLHRQGVVEIKEVTLVPGNGTDPEVCDCLIKR